MHHSQKYTVRVYALIFSTEKEILLLHENYMKLDFTKFPGGGMEKGEGTLDCLKRELNEELGLSILEFQHFYTTDFYVESAFDKKAQVISIYYKVKQPIDRNQIQFDHFDDKLKGYTFKKLSDLSEDDLTFPIDKKVVRLLL